MYVTRKRRLWAKFQLEFVLFITRNPSSESLNAASLHWLAQTVPSILHSQNIFHSWVWSSVMYWWVICSSSFFFFHVQNMRSFHPQHIIKSHIFHLPRNPSDIMLTGTSTSLAQNLRAVSWLVYEPLTFKWRKNKVLRKRGVKSEFYLQHTIPRLVSLEGSERPQNVHPYDHR